MGVLRELGVEMTNLWSTIENLEGFFWDTCGFVSEW